MYIVDGIAYAGEQEKPIRVKSVRALSGYKLRLRFTNETEKEFDFNPLLSAPAFQPLKDENVFRSVYVDRGFVTWCDGSIDIAPERLYNDSTPIQS